MSLFLYLINKLNKLLVVLQNKVLQRIIKILILFIFLVFSKQGYSQCVGAQSSTMSPAGPYSPGQVVTVTYTLSSFNQINFNWIIAFDIDLGAGWSAVSPVSAPGNPGGSSGNWLWDTQNTYPSGLNFGPGYRFQNSSWSNPDYGTVSTGPFTFSFQLTVGNACTSQDLSVDISAIGDCQTGGWSGGACCAIVPYSVYSSNSVVTLPTVVAGTSQTICHGGTPSNLTATASSTGSYSWSPSSAFTNPNIQNPSFNSGVTNTTTYTVTFTDNIGCTATDTVTITTNPIPTVTLTALPNPACYGDDIILTANSSIPVNKYRFQYNNGGGWTNLTTPVFGNSNPVTYTNITSTTQFRVKVRENNGCTSSSWSPVITVPINTVVTPPISHN
jgi:hypothetical protein